MATTGAFVVLGTVFDTRDPVVDKEEQIKWWDALYAFRSRYWELGLESARESRHPDARWLAAVFPTDVDVTRQLMLEVLLAQREDPRALFLAWLLSARSWPNEDQRRPSFACR
jgi:hypothetical protein